MIFKKSNWRIVSSYGQSGTVGIPVIKVQVGASSLNLPMKNDRTSQEATLKGVGIGAAVGVALDSPISDIGNYSISTKDMPSTGLGSIFYKENSSPYDFKDFFGIMSVITGGAGVSAINGTISMAVWQRYAVTECISNIHACSIINAISETNLILNPATMPKAVYDAIHAIGFFTGLEATTDIADVGANAFTYYMSS